MSCFSKIFVLSLFCMCTLNCSAYCMESGSNAAPDVANSNVNIEELPTPDEKKSESKEESTPSGETKSNNEVKPNDETKPGNETVDKSESDKEIKSSSEEKSKEDSSNVVGKVTVDVKERESSMDYYIIYDENGNVVEIKDAKDSSDGSDEKQKDRIRSYSYSKEIIYYRS